MTAALPARFVERVRAQLGEDDAAALCAALDTPPVRAMRVNPLKTSMAEACAIVGVAVDRVPWCERDATYLSVDEARFAAASPGHAAGLWYLQEPSAMAVVEALGVAASAGALVFDAAASPGGKATHLASAVGVDGVVVANEVVRARVGSLLDNVERWGAPNTMVTSASLDRVAAAAPGVFDAAVVDAPCSGEAMFRKDEVARRAWSDAHVAGSAARQALLLASTAEVVRAGGSIAYSTCTFNEDENEAVVARFLDAHPSWAPVRTERYWPHRSRCDGHVVTVLRRSAADEDTPSRSVRISRGLRPENPHRTDRALVDAFVRDLDWGRVVRRDDSIYLVPPAGRVPPELPSVVRGGLPLGKLRAGRFEPSHALAISTLALTDGFEHVDLDEDGDARQFLAGHVVERDGEPGWLAVRWRGHRIGWGKRTAGRVKPRIPRRVRTAAGR